MSDFKEILEELGYKLIDDNNGWRSTRLYANGDNSTALKIFADNGRFVDFVEGKQGTFEELVALSLGNKSIEDAKAYLQTKELIIPEVNEEIKITTTKIFPPETLDNLEKNHLYWQNRGINKEIIEQFQGGIWKGKGKMAGRYVFPIFDENDKIIGLTGRLLGEGKMKWKNSSGADKKNWVWPRVYEEEIKKTKTVGVTESPGDCLSCLVLGRKNTLCSFGTSVNWATINYMLRLDCHKIIISFNYDENNAGQINAEKAQRKLKKYFDSVIIKYPPRPFNDWNDYLLKKK